MISVPEMARKHRLTRLRVQDCHLFRKATQEPHTVTPLQVIVNAPINGLPQDKGAGDPREILTFQFSRGKFPHTWAYI